MTLKTNLETLFKYDESGEVNQVSQHEGSTKKYTNVTKRGLWPYLRAMKKEKCLEPQSGRCKPGLGVFANLRREVIRSDFWAPTWPPCGTCSPVMSKAARHVWGGQPQHAASKIAVPHCC